MWSWHGIRQTGHENRENTRFEFLFVTLAFILESNELSEFHLNLAQLLESWGDAHVLAAGGALIGLLFGFMAQRSRFCARAAVLECCSGQPGDRFSVWWLAFGAALMGTQLLVLGGEIKPATSRFIANPGSISGAVLGGLCFGAGMILTRGCASRLLILSANGNLRALLSGLVFAVTVQAAIAGWLAPARQYLASLWPIDGGSGRDLMQLSGTAPWGGLLLASLALASMLSAVIGVLQVCWPQALASPWMGWIQPSHDPSRAVGHMRQPNHLATLVVWGAIAWAVLHAQARLPRGAGMGGMAVLMVGLVLSGSRTGLLAVALLPLWALLDQRLPRHTRRLLLAAPLMAAAAVAALHGWAAHSGQALGVVTRTLQNLLAERLSIRNLPMIVEAIVEVAAVTKNPLVIGEHVRRRLAAQICHGLEDADGFVPVMVLGPKWDAEFAATVRAQGEEAVCTMSPAKVQDFVLAARVEIQKFAARDEWPALLVNSDLRPIVRSMLERVSGQTQIISHSEIHRKARLKTVGAIGG